MYLKIFPPPLGNVAGTVVQVFDSVATLMVQYIELYIGSELIERLYGEFIELRYDLEISAGKQLALQNLIGKYTVNPYLFPVNTSYTIPLPFSVFVKGLPLCAFKEDVSIRIVWNPSVVFTSPAVNVTTPFRAYLDTEYTYISEPEIQAIRSKPQVYLLEQIQRQEFFVPYPVQSIQCLTEFLNPVKEIFMVLQNDSAYGYDYTTDNTNAFTGFNEQLQSFVLVFNATERISTDIGTPGFLRVIQPLEYHTPCSDSNFLHVFVQHRPGKQRCTNRRRQHVPNQESDLPVPVKREQRKQKYKTVRSQLQLPRNWSGQSVYDLFELSADAFPGYLNFRSKFKRMEEAAFDIFVPVVESATVLAAHYANVCSRNTVTAEDMRLGMMYAARNVYRQTRGAFVSRSVGGRGLVRVGSGGGLVFLLGNSLRYRGGGSRRPMDRVSGRGRSVWCSKTLSRFP
jgi:hypothetical protein